jgi:response regulator RpfG family c-di-GMP phosphodiesterase
MTHHERWDGSGYPQHLKGQEIPLSGSICALLDVYDALTTARIYRQIIAEEEALRIINENSGILFDPKIVKAFEKEFLEIRKIKNACEKN